MLAGSFVSSVTVYHKYSLAIPHYRKVAVNINRIVAGNCAGDALPIKSEKNYQSSPRKRNGGGIRPSSSTFAVSSGKIKKRYIVIAERAEKFRDIPPQKPAASPSFSPPIPPLSAVIDSFIDSASLDRAPRSLYRGRNIDK